MGALSGLFAEDAYMKLMELETITGFGETGLQKAFQ